MTSERRWKIIAQKLAEQRELGKLGVIAASTGIAEYRLHDFAKSGAEMPLMHSELMKLWDYFEGRKT